MAHLEWHWSSSLWSHPVGGRNLNTPHIKLTTIPQQDLVIEKRKIGSFSRDFRKLKDSLKYLQCKKTTESSVSGFFVLSGMQRIGNLAPYYQWVVHLPPSSRYTWHQGGLGASSLKEVRWLKKFQAVWDSLLSANKSHFQDLTSTVSLRSGGLLSENWNSQHCHCCQRICQLHPHRNSSSVPSCVTSFRNIYQNKFGIWKNEWSKPNFGSSPFEDCFFLQLPGLSKKGGIQLPNFVVFMFPNSCKQNR